MIGKSHDTAEIGEVTSPKGTVKSPDKKTEFFKKCLGITWSGDMLIDNEDNGLWIMIYILLDGFW